MFVLLNFHNHFPPVSVNTFGEQLDEVKQRQLLPKTQLYYEIFTVDE